MNERLRAALLRQGISVERLARQCGVDPKTAERWISTGRTPHRRHRAAVVELLGVAEDILWPSVNASRLVPGATVLLSEIVRTYPDRASVPRNAWLSLLDSTTTAVDILVFSGTFLQQTNPRVADMLLERSAGGVRIRLCFGDPSGSTVRLRDEEEGLDGTLGAKIRASLSYYTKLVGDPNCGLRLHNTTLYASLFRFDNQLLVNPHIWGQPAVANPVIHVRGQEGDGDSMFSKYLHSFDQVWERAIPWEPDAARQTR